MSHMLADVLGRPLALYRYGSETSGAQLPADSLRVKLLYDSAFGLVTGKVVKQAFRYLTPSRALWLHVTHGADLFVNCGKPAQLFTGINSSLHHTYLQRGFVHAGLRESR